MLRFVPLLFASLGCYDLLTFKTQVEMLKSKLASGVMGAGGSTERSADEPAPTAASGGGGGKASVVSPAVLVQALRAKLAQMESGEGT